MTDPVRVERRGEIALLVIDHPPVNAIDHAVRERLLALVVAADADPAIRAIVIHGAGPHFIAGADIREFEPEQGPQPPLLNDVLLRLEACSKPVVAALHGSVIGGGFELALASHYRAATADVQISMPELKLGLIPGSGATVRLPRAIGVSAALEMMIGGEPVGLAKAQSLGLIDHVLNDAQPVDGAVAFARELIAKDAPPVRLRERAIPDAGACDDAFFAAHRSKLPRSVRRLRAAERLIESVAAAVRHPFDEALAFARQCFEECRKSVDSRALRYLFLAERGARATAQSRREIQSVAVIGAGTMGSAIAATCTLAGLNVTLIDSDPKALETGLGKLREIIEGSVKKGRITRQQADGCRGRTVLSVELAAARSADLVIEAVIENLAVKQEVFAKLDAVVPSGGILASNTSTLDIDALARATRRPAAVLGMHFFSPAHVMRVVEIVRGRATSADTLAAALAVTRQLGKIGVVVGNCYGFVGNRMLYAYGRENQLMLLEGAEPQRIDAVLEEFGMAMGPNAVGDLAGLDVGYRARRERKERPEDPRFYRVADALVEAGRYGQKTGKGMYLYDANRTRQPDPEVSELIRAEARRLGVVQREIRDAEIIERCIYALINEGALLLGEGIAASPQDIDVIWANGYGFPRWRGGPMFYADTIGLTRVYRRIREFERDMDPRYWKPAPLLEQLALEGRTFRSWQQEINR